MDDYNASKILVSTESENINCTLVGKVISNYLSIYPSVCLSLAFSQEKKLTAVTDTNEDSYLCKYSDYMPSRVARGKVRNSNKAN